MGNTVTVTIQVPYPKDQGPAIEYIKEKVPLLKKLECWTKDNFNAGGKYIGYGVFALCTKDYNSEDMALTFEAIKTAPWDTSKLSIIVLWDDENRSGVDVLVVNPGCDDLSITRADV